MTGAAQLAGHGDESAVMTLVAAQSGQRNEDLAGIGDDAGRMGGFQARVAYPGGGLRESRQVGAAGPEQHRGLAGVEGDAFLRAVQGASHGIGGGLRQGHSPRICGGTDNAGSRGQ